MVPSPKGQGRRSIKVSESVARDIVRDVADLKPGSRLRGEAAMLEKYNVSRGSLREALRILEAQGLISMKPGPGGGPVLVGPNAESLARMQSLHFHLMGARYSDLLSARVSLEPQLVRMAAEREDRDVLEVLKHFLSETEEDSDYLDKSKGFHRLVCSLSGNQVLDMLAQSLQHIVHYRVRGAIFSGDVRRHTLTEHADIARAVLDGNGPKAELLMRDHMRRLKDGVAVSNAMTLDEVVDWA
jgi:GntR family transcriptional repressor for pyruvate dehydrogenase complex